MNAKSIIALTFVSFAMLIAAACRKGGSMGGEREIKSTKSGDMTIALSSSTGALKKGENDLMILFADATGKSVDVGAASLNFHMAAMGSMAEMNGRAALTTTDTPGKYQARVNIEMAGTWEAQVKYQGQHGSGQVSMTVQAK